MQAIDIVTGIEMAERMTGRKFTAIECFAYCIPPEQLYVYTAEGNDATGIPLDKWNEEHKIPKR